MKNLKHEVQISGQNYYFCGCNLGNLKVIKIHQLGGNVYYIKQRKGIFSSLKRIFIFNEKNPCLINYNTYKLFKQILILRIDKYTDIYNLSGKKLYEQVRLNLTSSREGSRVWISFDMKEMQIYVEGRYFYMVSSSARVDKDHNVKIDAVSGELI